MSTTNERKLYQSRRNNSFNYRIFGVFQGDKCFSHGSLRTCNYIIMPSSELVGFLGGFKSMSIKRV